MGLKVFERFQTIRNKCQQVVVVPCKRTQHVGPNNDACCWPTMLRPFAWTLKPFLNSNVVVVAVVVVVVVVAVVVIVELNCTCL